MSVRITHGYYKYLNLETNCPVCDGLCESLDDRGYFTQLRNDNAEFFCDRTENCPGDFAKSINWGEALNQFIESRTE
jgi:hypothetical protein